MFRKLRHLWLAAAAMIAALPPAQAQILYIGDAQHDTIGVYNALTGAAINPALVNGQGLDFPGEIVLDGSGHLFVTNGGSNGNTVGEYSAATGATINSAFVSNSQGQTSAAWLALDGNNHLFVVGQVVGDYNATTGATINSAFISGIQGIPSGVAVDGHDHIFVSNGPGGTVGEYNATTGAAINTTFISGLSAPTHLALDTLGHLLVAENVQQANGSYVGKIGEYDATTGAAINPNFITGFDDPQQMALDGANHLFVADVTQVGEYNATTGAAINPSFITGFTGADGLVFSSVGVPEPGSLALVGTAAAAALGWAIRRRRRSV